MRYLIYQVKIIMESFYPLMLNTAKRSRTTVEALELRGYRYAAVNQGGQEAQTLRPEGDR